jgi:carboxymethylenebutenolidase
VAIVTRPEAVPVEGGTMGAFLAVPEVGRGPGLVLFPEIFGANRHMRRRATQLAGWGYTTLLVDSHWRSDPGLDIDERDADAMPRAMAAVGRLDRDRAVEDGVRAVVYLHSLPEARSAGVFGYCLGGMLAYLVAAADAPAVAVCYYPSGSNTRLEAAASIECPALFHFGTADAYLPSDIADQMRAATSGNPAVEIHVHPGANHAFDNDDSAFHHAEAREAAERQTREFLRRVFPTAAL